MNCVHYPSEGLRDLFSRQRIARLPELAEALGTASRRTGFRRLGGVELPRRHSHRGAYYTLDSLVRFDAQGLWSQRGVLFSKYGTLLDTAAELAGRAPAGCFAGGVGGRGGRPGQGALGGMRGK